MVVDQFPELEFVSGYRADFPEAEAFYQSVDYHTAIDADDLLLLARNDMKIIGLVRLAFAHQLQVLRGMMIAPAYQRQGVGKKMLEALQKLFYPENVYCISRGYLVDFYGEIGFSPVCDNALPDIIQSRIEETRKKYSDVVGMVRKYPIVGERP